MQSKHSAVRNSHEYGTVRRCGYCDCVCAKCLLVISDVQLPVAPVDSKAQSRLVVGGCAVATSRLQFSLLWHLNQVDVFVCVIEPVGSVNG